MYQISSFRLSPVTRARKVALFVNRRYQMNRQSKFDFIDSSLFLFVLFLPVTVLFASALASVASGSA